MSNKKSTLGKAARVNKGWTGGDRARARGSMYRETDDSLDAYLKQIGKVPLLEPEQEKILARRIKEGDRLAEEALVKANLRFVVSVAKQYQNQGMLLPDLINEGNIGLIKAARRFNEDFGYKFISYAVWWIRQAILQALAENSRVVRVPLNRIGMLSKIKRFSSRFEAEHGRPPDFGRIAEELETTEEDVLFTLESGGSTVHLDDPVGEGGGKTGMDLLEDVISPSAAAIANREELKRVIADSLGDLSSREAGVISAYFGIDGPEQTLEEIGLRYNLTRERVRQLKEKGLRRLRIGDRGRRLRAFLVDNG